MADTRVRGCAGGAEAATEVLRLLYTRSMRQTGYDPAPLEAARSRRLCRACRAFSARSLRRPQWTVPARDDARPVTAGLHDAA